MEQIIDILISDSWDAMMDLIVMIILFKHIENNNRHND